MTPENGPNAGTDPFAPGQLAGRYRILGRLGSGGMGVVYKAEDPALGRLVALKFLPPGQAGDAAAVERFRREARLAATLDHPNICTIYEIGDAQLGGAEAVPFMAMQYLEGQTLRARIGGRPLPLDRLLEWGAEIAGGLAAAHAKGIIHRDIKPANILITNEGLAKILDFGLAKSSRAGTPPAAAGDDAPTLAYEAQLTTQGATIGTVAYMSPEQVRGEELDARSDLFSFGLVLYEMAAGRPAFGGATGGLITDGILHRAPQPPQNLNPEVPEKLAEVICKALEKDRDLRCQSAAELRADLLRLQRERRGKASSAIALPSESGISPAAASAARASAAGSASAGPASQPGAAAPSAASPPISDSRIILGLPRRRRVPVIAIMVVIAAIIAFAFWRLRRPASSTETIALTAATAANVPLHFQQLTFSGNVQAAAISRDGEFLAYVEKTAQGRSLHLLSIGSASSVQLVPPGNGCCYAPAITPDGSAVYYVTEPSGNQPRAIASVPILGGTPQTVLTHTASGVAFSPHGRRMAFLRSSSPGIAGGLVVANADGSGLHLLVPEKPGAGFADFSLTADFGGPDHPAWSPDGRTIAATLLLLPRVRYQIALFAANGPAGGNAASRLIGPELPGLNGIAWLPGGGLLTTISRHYELPRLWRVAIPSGRLTPVASEQDHLSGLSVAANGAFVTLREQDQGGLWVGRASGTGPLASISAGREMDGVVGVSWTPNGDLISARMLGTQYGLWRESADGGQAAQIPSAGVKAVWPEVASNGQIVFTGLASSGITGVWRMNADGSNLTNLTPALKVAVDATVLGRNRVIFAVPVPGGERLWGLPLAGGQPRPLSNETFSGRLAASPDGRHVFGYCVRTGKLAVTGSNPQACILDLAVSPPSVRWLPKFNVGKLPAWAPGGQGITTVHNRQGAENIWLYPLNGGAPRQVTHFHHLLIAAYAWSRDGRLAVSRLSDSTDAVLVSRPGS